MHPYEPAGLPHTLRVYPLEVAGVPQALELQRLCGPQSSNRQPFASGLPPPAQHVPSAGRRHPGAVSVDPLPASPLGLVSALHRSLLWPRASIPTFLPGRQGRPVDNLSVTRELVHNLVLGALLPCPTQQVDNAAGPHTSTGFPAPVDNLPQPAKPAFPESPHAAVLSRQFSGLAAVRGTFQRNPWKLPLPSRPCRSMLVFG